MAETYVSRGSGMSKDFKIGGFVFWCYSVRRTRFRPYWRACTKYGVVRYPDGRIINFKSVAEAKRYIAYAYAGKEARRG